MPMAVDAAPSTFHVRFHHQNVDRACHLAVPRPVTGRLAFPRQCHCAPPAAAQHANIRGLLP